MDTFPSRVLLVNALHPLPHTQNQIDGVASDSPSLFEPSNQWANRSRAPSVDGVCLRRVFLGSYHDLLKRARHGRVPDGSPSATCSPCLPQVPPVSPTSTKSRTCGTLDP